MFSDYVTRVRSEVAAALDVNASGFDDALAKARRSEPLSLRDLGRLISAPKPSERQAVLETAATRTRELMGHTIGLIAPLYLDNHCHNECRYCAMSAKNQQLKRMRIETRTAFVDEARTLQSLGYRTVELVAGGCRIDADEINAYIRILETFGILHTAFFFDTLSADQYEALGARSPHTTMIHWQETYDCERYREFHPAQTPKGDYSRRLDAIDVALTHGLRKYAIGALFGLADPYTDTLMCVGHGRYLTEAYGTAPRALGLVRLQPAPGAEIVSMPYPVNEDMHLFLSAILRLAFPEAEIIVTSRETPAHIGRILQHSGTFTNATCTTVPGGYARHVSAGVQTDGQFLHDSPTLAAVSRMVKGLGLVLEPERQL